jgi:hypothetical protein
MAHDALDRFCHHCLATSAVLAHSGKAKLQVDLLELCVVMSVTKCMAVSVSRVAQGLAHATRNKKADVPLLPEVRWTPKLSNDWGPLHSTWAY